MMMNNCIIKVLVIFTISTSMITIVSTGMWLLNQPSDMCLGNTTTKGRGEFTSIIYVGAGLFLVVSIVYLFLTMPMIRRANNLGNNNNGEQRMFLAMTCFVLQLVVLILVASVYALMQSTVGFASLQRWVVSPERWWNIEQCLYLNSKVCANLEHKCDGDTQEEFLARQLTPIEYGCCKPPLECNFKFSSSTVWMKPENGSYTNKDCEIWNNDPDKLCYGCQECKLGYAQELKRAWAISGATVLIMLLMFVSAIILPRVFLAREQENLS